MATSTRLSPDSLPTGCLSRFIGVLCGSYLIFMLAYLGLRIIFGSSVWWLALLNAFAIYTFAPLLVLLPLAMMAGRWRMTLRLGLLALLAVIWFGPFFQPANIGSVRSPAITVATFNAERARGGFGSEASIAEFVAWLDENNVDILMLQETPADFNAPLYDPLRDRFPHTHTETTEEVGDLRRSLLSTLPLDDISSGPHFLRAVIPFEGQEIALYNIHFDWPFRSQPRIDLDTGSRWVNLLLRYDEEPRNEQIEAFLEVIAEETLPYIVVGDFNTSQHSIIYGDLTVAMEDSFREASSGLGATWPAEGFGALVPPLLRIDYIWHGNNFRAIDTAIGPRLGSDHFPYLATLVFRSVPLSGN
jgi:endonuclease/exonuclease/phosphatase (EEP) superfamily protein YafD